MDRADRSDLLRPATDRVGPPARGLGCFVARMASADAMAMLRDAGAAADYAAMLGLLTNWSVVGPFELGENNAGWNKGQDPVH